MTSSLNGHADRGNRMPGPQQQGKKFIETIIDTPLGTLDLLNGKVQLSIVTGRDLGERQCSGEGIRRPAAVSQN